MSKPLGRDRLGRLVYENDLIRDVGDSFFVRLARQYSDKYEIRFNSEVDLVLSPKHTNHERYFADIGTLDQVVQCSDEICKQYDGKACTETSCPFCWWSLYFGADGPCLESFAVWLEQVATI